MLMIQLTQQARIGQLVVHRPADPAIQAQTLAREEELICDYYMLLKCYTLITLLIAIS